MSYQEAVPSSEIQGRLMPPHVCEELVRRLIGALRGPARPLMLLHELPQDALPEGPGAAVHQHEDLVGVQS